MTSLEREAFSSMKTEHRCALYLAKFKDLCELSEVMTDEDMAFLKKVASLMGANKTVQ